MIIIRHPHINVPFYDLLHINIMIQFLILQQIKLQLVLISFIPYTFHIFTKKRVGDSLQWFTANSLSKS